MAMKDLSSTKRAEFYRIKAAEAREKAKGTKDLETRRTMLESGGYVGSHGRESKRSVADARPGGAHQIGRKSISTTLDWAEGSLDGAPARRTLA
jgi:hypothetical protein